MKLNFHNLFCDRQKVEDNAFRLFAHPLREDERKNNRIYLIRFASFHKFINNMRVQK